jgi:hypothetical protein
VSERSKLGLATLAAAIAAGLLGDGLLRVGLIGLNGFLWVAAVIGALLLISRLLQQPLTGTGRWLLLPAALLAAAYIWRDSPALLALDTLALAGTMALAAAYARSGDVRRAGIIDYGLKIAGSCVFTIGGMLLLLFGDVQWGELPKGKWSAKAAAVLRGLLIAIPLLLVFGGLFMAADAVFAKLTSNLLSVNLDNFFSHLFLTGFLAWITAGFIRTALAAQAPDFSKLEKPASVTLGTIETGLVLGLLNLLFAAFVIVQFRYFFGGASLVEATTGLTYAEYARNGFFELVGVTALVLPMLLLGHWLMPAESKAHQRLFRGLAGTLVALLFVIMASAAQRMYLYQQQYGLTELRLYSSAAMVGLALMFVWFLLTVMRGRRDRFIFGAAVAALAVLAALHVANPDALITRVNLARMEQGKEFDAAYVASLSADAVPLLVDALPQMTAEDQATVTQVITDRWSGQGHGDWRSWNWARSRARLAAGSSAAIPQGTAQR